MHINGTKPLLKVLQKNGLKYLLTSKINHDALENLFSQLRSRGGLNDHPSPLNALFRIRLIILGKNPCIVSNYSNTADKNVEEFMIAKALQKIDVKINNVKENSEDAESLTDTTSENESSNDGDENQHDLELDATEYLAGWVAKKYKLQFPELGSIHNNC